MEDNKQRTTYPNMQTILLLSSTKYFINNPLVLGKLLKGLKVAFIINASKVTSDTFYVEKDKNFFREQGCNIFELDLDGKTETELRKILKDCGVVFIEGGSTFYLLKSIRESGFEKVVKELLPQGLIYIGVSAGSYVACPTIEMATWKHPDENHFYGLEDLSAMNLVPFLLVVHYKPGHHDLFKEKISQASLPTKILTDQQALLIKDDKIELLGEEKEINL